MAKETVVSFTNQIAHSSMTTQPFHSVDSGIWSISLPDEYFIITERLYESAFTIKGREIVVGNHHCSFAFLLSTLNGTSGRKAITSETGIVMELAVLRFPSSPSIH